MTQRIVTDPRIMGGRPVVKGTRITVGLIAEKLAAGRTIDQILEEHPHLSEADIRAAADHAAAYGAGSQAAAE